MNRAACAVAGLVLVIGTHPASSQFLPSFRQGAVTTEANARDNEVTDSDTNSVLTLDFSPFQTNISSAASVASALSSSSASQDSSLSAYFIAATGSVSAAASVDTNLIESASAAAQSISDVVFDLTNRHAYSFQGTIEGAVSSGSLIAQILLFDNGAGTNLFSRILPGGAGAFATNGILEVGTYRFLIEFRLNPDIASSLGPPATSGDAGYSAVLRVIPQPEFTQIAQGGSSVTTAWTSISGGVYQVQHTAALESGVWTNLGGPVTAVQATASFEDTNSTPSVRCYRVSPAP